MPHTNDSPPPPIKRWPGWLVFLGFALFCLIFMLLLWWQLPAAK